VSELAKQAMVDTLTAGYGRLTEAVSGLDDAQMMRASPCAGWAVGDVLYHQLLDARRALRAFATPAGGPADRDYVSYWRSWSPSASPGQAARDAAHARHVRIAAAAYSPGELAGEWSETSAAACRAAQACGHERVATQGHVLETADFIATLAVEAAVHYLDLAAGLGSAPPADPAGLALARRVLAGLAGAGLPAAWDDTRCALKGTGREPLTGEDRRLLGPVASRFPLFA
jgi:uncharacterized protein (TIGR03083 family)